MSKEVKSFQERAVRNMMDKMNKHLELEKTATTQEDKAGHAEDAEFVLTIIEDACADYGWSGEQIQSFYESVTTKGDA